MLVLLVRMAILADPVQSDPKANLVLLDTTALLAKTESATPVDPDLKEKQAPQEVQANQAKTDNQVLPLISPVLQARTVNQVDPVVKVLPAKMVNQAVQVLPAKMAIPVVQVSQADPVNPANPAMTVALVAQVLQARTVIQVDQVQLVLPVKTVTQAVQEDLAQQAHKDPLVNPVAQEHQVDPARTDIQVAQAQLVPKDQSAQLVTQVAQERTVNQVVPDPLVNQANQVLPAKLSKPQHTRVIQLPPKRGSLPLLQILTQRRRRDTKSATTNDKLLVGIRPAFSFAVQIPSIVLVYYERFKISTVALSSYFILFLTPSVAIFRITSNPF